MDENPKKSLAGGENKQNQNMVKKKYYIIWLINKRLLSKFSFKAINKKR